MDIQGADVHSPTFGAGTVIQQTQSMIAVDFGGNIKKFLYPSGFEAFLTADDPEIQAAVQADVAAEKAEAARRQRTEKHIAMYKAEQEKAEARRNAKPARSARKK